MRNQLLNILKQGSRSRFPGARWGEREKGGEEARGEGAWESGNVGERVMGVDQGEE